jgi:hypothetical protein
MDCKITDLPNGGKLWEYNDGSKYYYLNNKYHRKDGPAIYSGNCTYWYIDGKLHREDGPAVEYINNHYIGPGSWWLNDKHVSQKEFERLMKLKAFW